MTNKKKKNPEVDEDTVVIQKIVDCADVIGEWLTPIIKSHSVNRIIGTIPRSELIIPDDKFSKIQSLFRSNDLNKLPEYIKYMFVTDLFNFGHFTGLITFKSPGNCFTNGGITWTDTNGNKKNDLCKSIFIIQDQAYDFDNDYNGITLTEYMKMLYTHQSTIRIDYTMSQFMAYEWQGAITVEMCQYLSSRDGLPSNKFNQLSTKVKKNRGIEGRQKVDN